MSSRPRAADDFDAIHKRLLELRGIAGLPEPKVDFRFAQNRHGMLLIRPLSKTAKECTSLGRPDSDGIIRIGNALPGEMEKWLGVHGFAGHCVDEDDV